MASRTHSLIEVDDDNGPTITVTCHSAPLGTILKQIGGLKQGTNQWILDRSQLPRIKMLEDALETQEFMKNMQANAKPRTGQRKYRRECSDVEDSDSLGSSSSRSSTRSDGSSDRSSMRSDESSDRSSGGGRRKFRQAPPKRVSTHTFDSDKYMPAASVDPKVLLAESSEEEEGSDYGSSSDSDFPDSNSPRNHDKEYVEVMERRNRLERKNRRKMHNNFKMKKR